MKGKLIFNGVSSEELGVVVQTPPTYDFPERDVESTHIPGRNGDLVVDNGCYKNVNRSYSLAEGFTILKHYSANAEAILEWLTSGEGKYCRLEDTYDPEVYRLAMYNQSGSFTNYYDKALSITVAFECKPQRYLKSGEHQIEYAVGNKIEINNPSHYPSLPVIKISGIERSISDILMMSITDSEGNVVSSITFTDIPNGTVTIDSEQQNCYDDDTDLNEDVNLNGEDFPKLNDGETTIEAKLYESTNGTINSYNSVISEKQDVVKSEYKPYETLELAQQNKFYVKSYESLVDSKKNTYTASAYQSYLANLCDEQSDMTRADTYTFTSFNTLMSSYCEQYSFSGDIAGLDFPSWMTVNQNGDEIKVTAAIDGFFISSNDKKIKLIRNGSVICTTKKTGTTTVTYYRKDDSTGKPVITYNDLPSWLDFELTTTTDGDDTFISQIKYKTKLDGYIWTDKTSLFGKASWNYYSAGTVLTTLSWSTIKKAFMPTTGITTSTTSSFKYRWVPSIIQYESSEQNIDFSVSSDTSLTMVTVTATKEGFYCGVNGSTKLQWNKRSVGDTIMSVKGTDSFEVTYLDKAPDYSDETDFPEWLDSSPVFSNTEIPMLSESITFKVTKTSKYRYSASGEDSSYSAWTDVEAESSLPMTKELDEYYYICQIDSLPTEYDYDRSYNDSADIPSWLEVKFYSDTDMTKEITAEEYRSLEDKSTCMVKYIAKNNEYYKWDSNSSWIKEDAGDVLLSTGYKDDTVFYHLSALPSYEDYAFEDYIKITPVEDSGGNPTEVNITTKISGYFRVNSNSNWEYFDIGDNLVTSTVGEITKIYYLKPSSKTLDSIQFTITPNWWML